MKLAYKYRVLTVKLPHHIYGLLKYTYLTIIINYFLFIGKYIYSRITYIFHTK